MIKKRIILLSFLILFIIVIAVNNTKHDNAIPVPVFVPLKSLSTPILVYHYVEYVTDEKDTIRKSLNTPPYLLTKQIETLKNAGYTFVTASELIDIMNGKIKPPNKAGGKRGRNPFNQGIKGTPYLMFNSPIAGLKIWFNQSAVF